MQNLGIKPFKAMPAAATTIGKILLLLVGGKTAPAITRAHFAIFVTPKMEISGLPHTSLLLNNQRNMKQFFLKAVRNFTAAIMTLTHILK